MRRRTLLTAAAGVGALALAGCASDDPTGESEPDDPASTAPPDGGTTTEPPTDDVDLPAVCPTSQDLDVDADWPTEPDADSVAAFVEAYEAVYYREVVVDYDPETSLAAYGLTGSVEGSPQAADGGWTLTYSGQGGVYEGTLYVEAQTADAPEDADVVGRSALDDARLEGVVETAAAEGAAENHVHETEAVTRYLEALPALSADVGEITERGQEEVLYVDVDGTTVRVTVTAGTFHGDYWWTARYYVTEHVVRRAEGEDADPREGELLECRTEG
jgi:hypothetical protein